MKLTYKEWLIKQKDTSLHRQSLLTLSLHEEFYKSKGIIPNEKNSVSVRSLNDYLSTKQNEFDLHKLKLALIDDKKINLSKIINFPYSHKNRTYYIVLLALIKNRTGLIEYLIKRNFINDINKKVISSFTLFHMILNTSLDPSICSALKPNTKFIIPSLFNLQYSALSSFYPITISVYKILLDIKKTIYPEKELNLNIFRCKCNIRNEAEGIEQNRDNEEVWKDFEVTNERFDSIKSECAQFNKYKLTEEENAIYNAFTVKPQVTPNLIYPIDLATMKNDEQEFNKLITVSPASLKYSKHAFYFCRDPTMGLKLYYYNVDYKDECILFHVHMNNFGMVVLLLGLGINKEYLRIAALLCVKMRHFSLLRLIMNSEKFRKDNAKSDKVILKLLCLAAVDEKNGKYELDTEIDSLEADYFKPEEIPCFSYELICDLSKFSHKPIYKNNLNFTDFADCSFNPKPILSFLKNLSWVRNKRWVETKAPWWWNSQEVHGRTYANTINRFDIVVRKKTRKEQILALCDVMMGCKCELDDIQFN